MRAFYSSFVVSAIAVLEYARAEVTTLCPGDASGSAGGEFTCVNREVANGNSDVESFHFVQKHARARKTRDAALNVSIKKGSGGDWTVVQCDAGKTVIGGGCYARDGPHIFAYNGPAGKDTWKCGGHGGAKDVWAFCAANVDGEMKSVSGGDWVEVQCDEGRKVIGGGCNADTHPYMFSFNGPSAADKWTCGGHGSNKRAWAFCASGITPFVQEAHGGDSTVASCGASWRKVIGGGCNAKTNPNVMQLSGPYGDDAWMCSGKGGDKQAWAICQVFPTPSPTPVPTPSPTMACGSFPHSSCPTARCVLSNDACTDYDWYILSERTDVSVSKSFKDTTGDESGCANLCGGESDAFVWASGNGSCWCAGTTNNFIASDTVAYYRVGNGILGGKACRLNEYDSSSDGRGTTRREYVGTAEECLSRCRAADDCKGVQFSRNGYNCRLWTMHIGRVVDEAGTECRSIAKPPVCTVADGSAPSSAHPCTCGLAVCADSSTNCFAMQNECKKPPPTPRPTEFPYRLRQAGKKCNAPVVGTCTGDAQTCAFKCLAVMGWSMTEYTIGGFVHCHNRCYSTLSSANANVWKTIN